MKSLFYSRTARHILFWLSVFAYFVVTSNTVFFRDSRHLIESTVTLMIPQIILAYLLLYVLIPKLLNKKKYVLFSLSLLSVMVIIFMSYVAFRRFYFDVEYYDMYNEIAKAYAKLSFVEQLIDPSYFVSKIVKFLTPTALLFTYRLYKDQQEILQLREQKRTAELSALKHQLNPHFLFNTLNNLYALAIERSDKTPEVIERLSEILDYMLYRCKENYVSLEKEIALIDNYLALEKIRYGRRVHINFEKEIEVRVKIAPLILLTFIENAFKHGVSQELEEAKISISLQTDSENIVFSITNSKSKAMPGKPIARSEAMGLTNISKQLNLLYPKVFTLEIEDLSDQYKVYLKIPAYGS